MFSITQDDVISNLAFVDLKLAILVLNMSGVGTGYDLSASTYSPDGKIFQVSYALKAVENSATSIALRAKVRENGKEIEIDHFFV